MLVLISLQAGPPALAGDLDLRGQLSGTAAFDLDGSFRSLLGLRYIPTLSLEREVGQEKRVRTVAALNISGSLGFGSEAQTEARARVKPYRLWARFTTTRSELRIGLQKIAFGPAILLRPLMWFDRIDPRDPLQLTEGVYGLLGRYYFPNNANLWLWGLYGNNGTKGLETLPTTKDSVEYGGRVQVPLWGGELGAGFHHRWIDPTGQDMAPNLSAKGSVFEQRYGLDGKWDLGVGLWFEGVLTGQDLDRAELRYQTLISLGMDYTFDLGNGLYLDLEHLVQTLSKSVFGSREADSISALSLNYPLGINDSLTAIFTFDWDNQDLFSYLNWQRKFDRWTFNLFGFWNPERSALSRSGFQEDFLAGKGLGLLVVFDH